MSILQSLSFHLEGEIGSAIHNIKINAKLRIPLGQLEFGQIQKGPLEQDPLRYALPLATLL